MKIEISNTLSELSLKAKNIIVQEIKNNKELLFCTAAGDSPAETYRLLSNEYKKQPGLFSHLRIIKLDEWGGIPIDNPATCESFLQTHLIKPLQIHDSRYIGFDSNPQDPDAECKKVKEHYIVFFWRSGQ